MAVAHEQELWVIALRLDREQGERGERFIAERVFHFDTEADDGASSSGWMLLAVSSN